METGWCEYADADGCTWHVESEIAVVKRSLGGWSVGARRAVVSSELVLARRSIRCRQLSDVVTADTGKGIQAPLAPAARDRTASG